MEAFLREKTFLDIVSYGEGELPFLRILERLGTRDWSGVPSVGYIAKDGAFVFSGPSEVVPDINEIPSPYLSGAFADIMSLAPDEKWQGMLETNRGCPYTCAFCYWGKKTERKVKVFDLPRVEAEIDWFSKHKVEFVFCCDANFGILARDFDIVRKVAENKKRHGYPNAFSVQNTKNSKKKIFELHKILHEFGLQKGVNLALQSTNEKTLEYIERKNIDNKTYNELQRMFTESDILTFTDIILGLPGETYESYANGVSEIIHNGQHNRIQFIDLEILENTEMADEEYIKKYGLKTVEAKFESHHTAMKTEEEVVEKHNLVVATAAMPGEDWVRAKVYALTASLVYFGKLLQVPFAVLHVAGGVPYRKLIEAFAKKDARFPVMAGVLSAFEQKAREIQNGGAWFMESKEWLNISWWPDELLYIRLSAEGNLDAFYKEADEILAEFVRDAGGDLPAMTKQAVELNRKLLKQPFQNDKLTARTDYNIWDVYQAVVKGKECAVKKGSFQITIDRSSQRWENWRDWAQKVVWYGYKKGDYIYPAQKSDA
jgi:radical SAM superfamily enzyme YgiQ (UPF0313 family)